MNNLQNTNFYNYFLADSFIEEIKVNGSNVEIDVYWDVKKILIKIICQEVVGITDIFMWDDVIIGDNVYLEEVDFLSNDFLIRAHDAHPYTQDCCNPLRDHLLDLSIELISGISFHVYCYSVMVEETDIPWPFPYSDARM